MGRITAVIWALLAITVAGWGQPSRVQAPPNAAFIALHGHDTVGNRIDIVWSPNGGDIVTTSPGGLRDEVWFSGSRFVHEQVDGGIDDYTSDDWIPLRKLQSDRTFLTGDAWPGTSPTEPTRLRLLKTVDAESGPGIAIRWQAVPFHQSYLDAQLYGFRGAFLADGPPLAVAASPPPPRSPWHFAATGEVVTAAIGGRHVRLLVDTGVAGLRISRRFAARLGERSTTFQSIFFVQSAPRTFVRLTDVRLGTAHVSGTFAELTDDDRADLYAGVDLFNSEALEFSRDESPRLSNRRCAAGDGVAARTYQGRVLLPEFDRAPLHQAPRRVDPALPEALNGPPFSTLLDTTYHGPPTFFPSGPERMNLTLPPTENHIDRCDGPSSVTLAMGGRRFGTGSARCEQNVAYVSAPLDQFVGTLVGLDSLDAKTLLVDLQNNRVCWYN